jgi:hypothetical protein
VIRSDKPVTTGFHTGLDHAHLFIGLAEVFFPFIWLSVSLLNQSISGSAIICESTSGESRHLCWLGVLVTFFWEMWNYYSYPKWTYQVAWGDGVHVFEMPLLGYGGYLPFALELFALYHLFVGWFGGQKSRYIVLPSN